jgi:hypothetical protein
MIKVAYLGNKEYDNMETAYSLTDQYFSEKRTTEINFEYTWFHEELSFPYIVCQMGTKEF